VVNVITQQRTSCLVNCQELAIWLVVGCQKLGSAQIRSIAASSNSSGLVRDPWGLLEHWHWTPSGPCRPHHRSGKRDTLKHNDLQGEVNRDVKRKRHASDGHSYSQPLEQVHYTHRLFRNPGFAMLLTFMHSSPCLHHSLTWRHHVSLQQPQDGFIYSLMPPS